MKEIDKYSFLECSIEDKVNYLNNKLNNGSTVTRIRIDLDISEKTLQRIIKDGGYRYERKLNNYVLNTFDKNNENLDLNKLVKDIEYIKHKVDKIDEILHFIKNYIDK